MVGVVRDGDAGFTVVSKTVHSVLIVLTTKKREGF